jgi:hypothetical protein
MPYPSSSYKGIQRTDNNTTNAQGSNVVNNFDSALETINLMTSETNILSSAKYPTDAPKGTANLNNYTATLENLVTMLNDYSSLLSSVISEYDSSNATQKSYINKTLNGEMAFISRKLASVQYMLNILAEKTVKIQAEPVPGYTEFPVAGSRYPSGQNRY